jgi:glucose-1-phosphate thymidylyltransferase
VGIVVGDPREMLQPDHRTGERTTVMVNSQAEIRAAVGDGSAFGIEVTYIEQEAPLGLAHAVKISEDFMAADPFVMYLGDNLIKDGITPFVREFEAERPDAQILLAHVKNPSEFGWPSSKAIASSGSRRSRPPAQRPGAGRRLPLQSVRVRRGARHSSFQAWRARDHRCHPAPHSSGKRVRSHVIDGWWKDTGKVEDMLEGNRMMLGALDSRIEGRWMLRPPSKAWFVSARGPWSSARASAGRW